MTINGSWRWRLLLAGVVLAAAWMPDAARGADAGEAGRLWQIGNDDRHNREFALAPDGYRGFREDPTFLVGTSDPA